MPGTKNASSGWKWGPPAQFGYSEPTDVVYASHFNGRDIVRKCVEANSQYLVIWARDGDWAYYDSKVARKCPGLVSEMCCGRR